jgi:hypothetical protein
MAWPPSCVFDGRHLIMERWKGKHTEGKKSFFLTPTTNAIGRLPNIALDQ